MVENHSYLDSLESIDLVRKPNHLIPNYQDIAVSLANANLQFQLNYRLANIHFQNFFLKCEMVSLLKIILNNILLHALLQNIKNANLCDSIIISFNVLF